MAQFKYVGGADEVEIPGVGAVKRGEVIEVAPPLSEGLAGQDVWEPVSGRRAGTVDLHAMRKADLEQLASERGVDLTGLTKKDEYIAALEAGAAETDTTEES